MKNRTRAATVGRHATAFFAIASFAVTCTLLSTLAASAQMRGGAAGGGFPGGTSLTSPAMQNIPVYENSSPSGATTTTPSTSPSTQPATTTPTSAQPGTTTAAPLGTQNCYEAASYVGGCPPAAATTPQSYATPPAGINTPPQSAYPVNPPGTTTPQ